MQAPNASAQARYLCRGEPVLVFIKLVSISYFSAKLNDNVLAWHLGLTDELLQQN